MVEDKRTLLGELARIVRPGGSVGLLVFVRQVDTPADTPADTSAGNNFPTVTETVDLLATVGLSEEHRAWFSDFGEPSRGWSAMTDAVEKTVRARWGTAPAWRTAHEEQQHLCGLLERGHVAGLMLACRQPRPT